MPARVACAVLCVALSAIGAGCAGDPDTMATRAALELVPRAAWEPAPVGCEDVPEAEALRLAAVEGEPALGALLDPRGEARCVDALHVLIRERGLADPTPTPLMPLAQAASSARRKR